MTFLRTFAFSSVVSIALGGTVACSGGGSKPVTMADSFDLDIFGPHVDDLHGPYVAGAEFQITVSADTSQSEQGWTLSSSDPNVIQITSPLSGGTASVTAGSAGVATLTVQDETGKVLDAHGVVVAVPDTVKLYAEGPLLTGASDSTAEVTQANVVKGGEATFLVRYYAQGVELNGSGALTPTGTSEIAVNTVSTSFAAARDFLQVSPAIATGTGSLSLGVAHHVVGELPVTIVGQSDVQLVTMLPQSISGAKTGDSLALYAHMVSKSNSADIYGGSFIWLINGQPAQQSIFSDGPADLFFYSYDASVTEDVTASFDQFSPYAIVHGTGGTVGSTASNLGCSVSRTHGARGSLSPLCGIAVAMGLALSRRRRAR